VDLDGIHVRAAPKVFMLDLEYLNFIAHFEDRLRGGLILLAYEGSLIFATFELPREIFNLVPADKIFGEQSTGFGSTLLEESLGFGQLFLDILDLNFALVGVSDGALKFGFGSLELFLVRLFVFIFLVIEVMNNLPLFLPTGLKAVLAAPQAFEVLVLGIIVFN